MIVGLCLGWEQLHVCWQLKFLNDDIKVGYGVRR